MNGLIAAGVVVVSASGNGGGQGVSACGYSPGRVPGAITVAATDVSDAVWSDSSLGTCVDLFAPGQGVTMASRTGNATQVTNSGTSFASPHVAGIVALYLGMTTWLRPADVAAFVTTNATSGVLSGVGSSPNRLAHSRWSRHWVYSGSENCYDLVGASCYARVWSPACPARPVSFKACGVNDSQCWSVASSTWLDDYSCTPPN